MSAERPLCRLALLAVLWGLGPAATVDARGQSPVEGWKVWGTEDGLPQSTVTAIVQDADGYLWLGTQEGLARFDGLRFTVYDHSNTPELGHNLVNALAVGPDGTLWIGTRRGLTRLLDSAFTHLSTSEGLPDEVVQALALDRFGRLWVGTRQGLALWDGHGFEVFTTDDGLPDDSIQSLWLDPRDRLWVGTEGGLARLESDEEQRFVALTTADGLSDDLVLSIGPGEDDEIWIGTMNGGVNRLDPETLEPLGVEPGLGGRIVFALARDRQGVLWLGTRKGLLRRPLTEPGTTPPGEAVLCLFEDSRGELWAGTARGGLWLREARPPSPSTGTPVLVESVRVGQQVLPAREELEVGRGPTDLEFRFTAIEFRQPSRVRFWHRLEGFDDHWIDDGGQRFASYTNLPAGKYRLEVAAFLPGSEDAIGRAALDLRIAPRLVDTWLFELALVLLLVAFTRFAFSVRVRRLLSRRRQLEAVVDERTQEINRQRDHLRETNRRLEQANRQLMLSNQELKALSREKADFLAIAAHDLRAPLVNLKGFSGELALALDTGKAALEPALETLPPELLRRTRRALDVELPEALGFIAAAAARMDTLIGPVLKLSRLSRRELEPRRLDLRRLVLEVVEGFELQRRELGATIRVAMLPELVADEDSLIEIFTQLIDNALSYLDPERPGKIEIFHQEKGLRQILHVRDNGRGIPEEQRAKVFRIFGRGGLPDTPGEGMGLVYVRTLVQRQGGRIWYESKVDRGSVFSFVLGDLEPKDGADTAHDRS